MPRGVFPHKRKPSLVRFWEKVDIRGSDDCWMWKGGGYPYGAFSGNPISDENNGYKRVTEAHRFSLEIKLGRLLVKGECSLHTCDRPRCVNPAHLFVGTNNDNSKDMVRKGRKEKGEQVYGARLTAKKVLKIRKLFTTRKYLLAELGAKFGVIPETIYHVVRGYTWKHVGGPLFSGRLKKGPKKGTRFKNPRVDLIGKKFNQLIVLRSVLIEGRSGFFWICRCNCGKETKPLPTSSINRGYTKSCGCLRGRNRSKT